MERAECEPYLAGNVADVMVCDPVVVSEDDTILDLVELFLEHHYHGVPVVNAEGSLVGVARDSEVMAMFVAKEPFVGHYRLVKEIMHVPPFVIRPEETIQAATKKMFVDGTRFLVVVDKENRVIGVVTRIDLIKGIRWKEAGT
jgi:CBS domain-containing protein